MDLYDTLELFYEISRIPMEVYKDGACIFRIPEEPFHPGFLRFICSSLFDSRHPATPRTLFSCLGHSPYSR